MAFVAEDGTGLADANSYAAVSAADAYFADRGIAAWTGTTSQKQAYLIRATDYIEGRFGRRFIGCAKTLTQALSWPRTNAGDYADDAVPVNLQRACFEYALRAISAPLAPDPKVDATGLLVVVKKKVVGPIETENEVVRSGTGSTLMQFRPYPAADMLLRGLLSATGGLTRG